MNARIFFLLRKQIKLCEKQKNFLVVSYLIFGWAVKRVLCAKQFLLFVRLFVVVRITSIRWPTACKHMLLCYLIIFVTQSPPRGTRRQAERWGEITVWNQSPVNWIVIIILSIGGCAKRQFRFYFLHSSRCNSCHRRARTMKNWTPAKCLYISRAHLTSVSQQ